MAARKQQTFAGIAVASSFILIVLSGGVSDPAQAQSVRSTVANVQPKIVKIIGSGGFQGLEPYQSGFLISSDGYIVTVWSYVLDCDVVKVTLDDGLKCDGKLVGYDPKTEMAILKIDADELAFFDIDESDPIVNDPIGRGSIPSDLISTGHRVLAFSNLFGIATGNEPASVQLGVVAAKTKLRARRGALNSNYRGDVIILDAMTNNPGSAGGAVTDTQGRLVGMIGKELKDQGTGSWLNFAIPITQLSRSIRKIKSGRMVVQSKPQGQKPSEPITTALLGLVLVPDIVSKTPPFVDLVIPNLAAARQGVKRDDLIIEIGGTMTPSINDVLEQLSQIDRDEEFEMTVQRDKEFVTLKLSLLR